MCSEFGKYEVYTDCGSFYCYKGSNVLKNKYKIREYRKLKEIEQDIVGAKQHYMLLHPIQGKFTINHLCNIHRFLFEDIYSFAGHFRRETIKKGSTTFLIENEISIRLSNLLEELKKDDFLLNLSYGNFIEKLAYYFAELNYIHPFRDGNGRAAREFIRLLVEKNGYKVNWANVEKDTLMEAMILSVYDAQNLKNVLKICIPGDE